MGNWLVVVVAFVASLAIACSDTEGIVDVDVEVDGHVVLSGDLTGACACKTEECRKQWVLDNMGCDLCVVFLCPDGQPVHVCALCAPRAILHTRVAHSQRE